MADLVFATLTNLDAGPRGVETAAGLVMIEAGGDARVELPAGALAAVERSGWFAVAASAPRRRKGASK
ncbi:hypothetical protein ACFOMD_01735 [Sphingoaurantiacus capsulatus]|uniref:Uncharacterized protein n=1 Tax=Sphingoaurantiacus capsulatus TaxID=1771310 RepID=A0ABV7X7R9_9SPHN